MGSVGSDTLKPGWKRVAFGDVVRRSAARAPDPEAAGFARYVGLEHLDPGDLTIRRWGDVATGTTFTSVFRPAHVLFGKRRAYQRKVAVPDFSGVCSGDIYVFESTNEHHLLPDLLPFICQTDGFFEHAIETSAGSLSPRTNWKSLAAYEFALPPVDEQQRIASALSSIRNAQDSHQVLCGLLATAMQGLVAQALVKFHGSTAASKLEEHADIRYGLTVNPDRREATEQISYLRVANVQRGTFDLTEIKTVGRVQDDDIHRLFRGDVLVVEGHADVAQIGRAAVWQNEIPDMFHQNHLIRVRCGDSLDPEYLCLLVNAFHGQSYFRSHAKSSSGLNTINSTVVKRYCIPVPSRELQSSLVRKARTGARLMERILARQDDLTRIRRTVLQCLEVA